LGRGVRHARRIRHRNQVPRLIATAQDYLQKNGLEQSPWRVDLISIHLDEKGKLLEVSHLENAVEE